MSVLSGYDFGYEVVVRVARAIDDASEEVSLAFSDDLASDTDTIRACRRADTEKRFVQARAALVAATKPDAIPAVGPAHQFTGNGPGVVGADNCQICFKWHDEHALWEATPPDMITAPGWINPDALAAAERRGLERAAAYLDATTESKRFADEIRKLALSPSPPAEAAEERTVLKKRPVAFRVKDHADGWVLFHDEQAANAEADKTGALMQGLYVRDGTAGESMPLAITLQYVPAWNHWWVHHAGQDWFRQTSEDAARLIADVASHSASINDSKRNDHMKEHTDGR